MTYTIPYDYDYAGKTHFTSKSTCIPLYFKVILRYPILNRPIGISRNTNLDIGKCRVV